MCYSMTVMDLKRCVNLAQELCNVFRIKIRTSRNEGIGTGIKAAKRKSVKINF